MGPGDPQPTIAPTSDVRGRQFDYPFGVNTTQRPRGEQQGGIDFHTLRALADPAEGGFDLLRGAIRKRKNVLALQDWTVRGRDGKDGGQRAKDIRNAMNMPDGVNTYDQWVRMLTEDLLVIDAPTVYLAPSAKGYRVPQVMDGALIKPLLRVDGRTPLPPDPAYQQSLKGMPAVNYTSDELIYLPLEKRSHRIYGYSQVEQVLLTVQIGLRRQVSQLEYYTAGSVPDVILGTPDAWGMPQVRELQEWWDSILSGNTEERRRARFLPGGVKPFELKPGQLKDDFDEWLGRIICWVFDLSPQALSKQMNRATAETSKQSAQEEGIEPLKRWLKTLLDRIIAQGFNAPDLEIAWADEEIVDPTEKATVFSLLVGGKPILTQDEAREEYGYQPMTPEQKDELQPAPPPVDPGGPPPPGEKKPPTAAEKVAKRVAAARRSL